MRNAVGGILCALVMMFGLHFLGTPAFAVSTMADWTGENTNAANDTMSTVTTNNNYGVISSRSVGGDIQSKINLSPEGFANINEHHVYMSDPSLDGPTLDFTSTLHMDGTITFNSPTATEPNICFCWYASSDTRHRIGLGISNLSATENPPNGAVADRLRIDFGYASTANPAPPPPGGNKFYFVSADGTTSQANLNSVIPNGTYPFTFDYTPGPTGMAGGSMSATVGSYFRTQQPLETQPWDLDFFTFDQFGLVQRSTGSTTNNPTNTYNVVFSNVTYTGGTALPGVPADYNDNGVVDGADYARWRNGGPLVNEVDNPGTVNAQDYTEWRARFGNTSGSGSGLGAGAVPEPATALLALLAGLATVAVGRCRP